MTWYQYVACFFSGIFLVNTIPHFVKGVCGDRFPTPFAKPPGQGLSSALVNVLWGLLNLVVGFILLRVGNVASGGDAALAVFFAGFAALSMMMSVQFSKKHPQ